MTDTELIANLYALEKRIYQLEQNIQHTVGVGDIVEVEQHLYGDVYEQRVVTVKGTTKEQVVTVRDK